MPSSKSGSGLNKAHKLLGVEFAPVAIPRERRLQTFAVLHYIFMFLITPPLSLLIPVYAFFYTSWWWVVALYLIWMYYDFDTSKEGGRVSEWVKDWKLWKHLRDYFPIHLHKTVDLDPKRNYVFGYHPHGVTSVGAFVNFATNATGFQKMFPGIKSHLLTLVGQFWYPVRREYIMMIDAHESSKEAMTYLLNKEPGGHAVVVVVGGAAEAVDAAPGKFDLTLKKRKGFVKMAIKNGADLVPVFAFGENDLFLQIETSPESMARRFQLWLKSYTGIPPMMFHGRGIFNYTFGLMPYRREIHTVVGKPIPVTRCENPTIEMIAEIHEKYIKGLEEVFETNKTKFGVPEDKHLNIVT